jgi:hypothetical protein
MDPMMTKLFTNDIVNCKNNAHTKTIVLLNHANDELFDKNVNLLNYYNIGPTQALQKIITVAPIKINLYDINFPIDKGDFISLFEYEK